MQLFNNSIGNYSSREFIGYNLYRNGLFITSTTELQYEDSDIVGGTEYCYDALAVYDEGISNLSNSDCASIEMPLVMGDMNNDGNVNVTDIIIEINIITTVIEATDYHWAVGDLNNDGAINVLDIVSIVNIILGGNGLGINSENGNAEISKNNLSLNIKTGIAGFQFNYSGDFKNNIESPIWNITAQNGVIVGYTLEKDQTIIELDISGIEIDGIILLSDLNGNGIDVTPNSLPDNFGINSIYPNPFNPVTTISFDIVKSSQVNIKVFDLLGNQVATLVNEVKNGGSHSISWDASGLSSGLYFVKMEANNEVFIDKLMLMK